MTQEEFLGAVLRLVNLARVGAGKEALTDLPKGKRSSRTTCPLAKALNGGSVSVGAITAYFPTQREAEAAAKVWGEGHVEQKFYPVTDHRGSQAFQVFLPDTLRDFVSKFDDEEFPQYDEDPIMVRGGES